MDFVILQGHRSVEEQKRLFHEGRTKIDGINHLSKHNHTPSLAVDIAPYPIDWNDAKRFYWLNGFVRAVALTMDINLRTGADWNCNGDFSDQDFNDLPHYELSAKGSN